MMSSFTQVLRNATRRPVELHFADRVEVLLPETAIELGRDELAQANIAPLLAQGVLIHHDPPKLKKPRVVPGSAKSKPGTITKAKPAAGSAKGGGKPVKSSKSSPATGKQAKHSGEPS